MVAFANEAQILHVEAGGGQLLHCHFRGLMISEDCDGGIKHLRSSCSRGRVAIVEARRIHGTGISDDDRSSVPK
jgi:hypothetical protein